jgi:hypothetical protein
MNNSPHNMTRAIVHPFLFGIWLMIAFVSPGLAQSVQLNVAQISRDQVTTAPGLDAYPSWYR